MPVKEKKIPVVVKIASRYYTKQKEQSVAPVDAFEILNDEETKNIRKIRIVTLILVAIIGAMGVLLLYIPQYLLPDFFNLYVLNFSLFSIDLEVPVITSIYGILLAFMESYLLLIVNLIAIHKIAKSCGFPEKKDPNYQYHVNALINIGIESPSKKMLDIGINPFQGMSKFNLFFFLLINKLQATISNIVFKIFIKRILGRYAFRMFVDLAGIPVFAAWNAWASNAVIKNAKVRIMAPGSVNSLCEYLYKNYSADESFKSLIYDTLQLTAILKRKFHENHNILAINLLKKFKIEIKDSHTFNSDYYEKLKDASDSAKEGISKLLVMGIIIDGEISLREYFIIKKMARLKLLKHNLSEIKKIQKSFLTGKGIGDLLS